jgi:DNA-binding MarR family transcriptional regulator
VDSESHRDLRLLEAIEQESTVTQRGLALRLGIALGLTNLYLKRLIRKGYVKCVTVAPNRLVYMVTPRGLARKARLTFEFMKYSLDFYRDARQHIRQSLAEMVETRNRIAIFGTGDVAELVYLLVKQMGLEPVAVFDDAGDSRFLGYAVRPVNEHDASAYDVLIVTVLERPAATRKRLTAVGVPPDKILMLYRHPLQPQPAGRAHGNGSAA